MLADLLEKMGLDPAGEKPVVGVSACLLGRPVRYNGETKYHAPTAEALTPWAALREFCPEVGIGLPVPRPPIQVVRIDGQERVRGVEDPAEDFTEALQRYALELDGDLDGFVFKARSPSCGRESTPLMDRQNRELGFTSGAFSRSLCQRLPALPVCDEDTLESPDERLRFLLRVYCHRQLRRRPDADALLRCSETLDSALRQTVVTQIRLSAGR